MEHLITYEKQKRNRNKNIYYTYTNLIHFIKKNENERLHNVHINIFDDWIIRLYRMSNHGTQKKYIYFMIALIERKPYEQTINNIICHVIK